MKKFSFAAGVSAIALAVSTIIPAAGVSATTIAAGDYTSGNPITLARAVSGVSNNVTNNFYYTIASTSTPNGGTVTGFPTNATINFSNVAPTGAPAEAVQTTTLNFSAADYSKVGDYEFTITETGSDDLNNYPLDATHSYKAYVSVRYYVDPTTHVPNNNRYVASVVLWNGSGYSSTSQENKISGYTATWGNTAARTYIEATETTTGNMAETNECFAYTINIATGNGVSTGDAFNVTSNTTCSQTSATSVTAGTPATVYLKNGETVTVGVDNGLNQLPVGASYTITKSNSSDNYVEKIDGNEVATITKTTVAVPDPQDQTAVAAFNTNNKTALENNLQSDPLTGIVTNFWFYFMLLIIGAFGLFIFLRKKQDDEEQQQA